MSGDAIPAVPRDGPEDVFPLRMGTSGEFAELRRLFEASGFTDAGVCARLGVPTVFDLAEVERAAVAAGEPADGLAALIRLFLQGMAVTRESVLAQLPAPLPALLERLGLVRDAGPEPALAVPGVALCPVAGLWAASDLDRDPLAPERDRLLLRGDAVYPANTKHTGAFLQVLPTDRCEAFLDLCSGTAIAALVAARTAAHAWAVDVTERATRFAEFNVALNGAGNVTVLCGDLFEPVAGRTFDRIVAHPPWVPGLDPDFIYRAGGDDGEQVTRRIIEGLGAHLRPGGRFYCNCMMTDRRGAQVEARLRAMLGGAHDAFDIAVIARAVSTPSEYFAGLPGQRHPQNGAHPGEVRLLELGVERLVLSTIAMRRHGRSGPPVTARRTAGPRTGTAEVEWLLDTEAQLLDGGLPARMVDTRPRVSAAVRLELISRPADGAWATERCLLHVDAPFRRTLEVPMEVAQFVAGCDGTLTIGGHLARAQAANWVPGHLTDVEFAASLLPLFGNGILVDGD